MSVLFCASLTAYIPNVTFSKISTSYSKPSQSGARMLEWDWCPPLSPVYTSVGKVLRQNGQKQEKKKALKINAKIEDVGLNEDLKSTETRNGH